MPPPRSGERAYPAGRCRKNDVILTSMRRDYVASASIRRHFGTKCPLGIVLPWPNVGTLRKYVNLSHFAVAFLSQQLLLQYSVQAFETCNAVQVCIEHVHKGKQF